jgi:hypothetical protein
MAVKPLEASEVPMCCGAGILSASSVNIHLSSCFYFLPLDIITSAGCDEGICCCCCAVIVRL